MQESAEKLTEMRTIFKSVTSPDAEWALAQKCCFGNWAADIWSAYTQCISSFFSCRSRWVTLSSWDLHWRLVPDLAGKKNDSYKSHIFFSRIRTGASSRTSPNYCCYHWVLYTCLLLGGIILKPLTKASTASIALNTAGSHVPSFQTLSPFEFSATWLLLVNAPLLSDLEDFSLFWSQAAFAVTELAQGKVFTGPVSYTIRALFQ